MNAEEHKQAREILHDDLLSQDTERVSEALGQMDGTGNLTTVDILSRLLASGTLDADQQSAVMLLLRDVKLEGGGAAILSVAVSLQGEEGRAELLALAWEAGASAEDNLLDLVSLAVKSSFEIQIEVMTLLDELEGIEDESEWTEACSILQEAIEERDPSEVALLSEMFRSLQNFEDNTCCNDGEDCACRSKGKSEDESDDEDDLI